ncbi:HD-GYP domain-containing protein [Rubinisphaera margarita]|uniref:HD-GYP domain-containing protein n=1 Tax=Rubinisphaera margarita TaxID=2909586 RepID=UPI001EE843DD|nr:HD domain-containing phosphohydrolase [Rubinisphaera margarita]MCG6154191.1 hypothetical protein [Rubinisphaera margarita]
MAATVIPLNELRLGAVLPAAIYDVDNPGVMLLNRGMKVTRDNLDRLRARNVSAVSIDSRHVNAVWANQVGTATQVRLQKHYLAEQRRQQQSTQQPLTNRLKKPPQQEYNEVLAEQFATNAREHNECLQGFYQQLQTAGRLRADSLRDVSLDSIDMLLSDLDLFVKSTIENVGKTQLSEHSCKVAKLAMSIAAVLGFTQDDVCQLGIGCMVSRAGISPEIQALIESPRKLTALERLEIKKYPVQTWHVLDKITDLSNTARQVAWQINERWNGQGYPRGRTGKQIHPLARIAAVADVFIALTSDRPQRLALTPYKAITQMLMETQQGFFEPQSIRGLLRTTCLFPIGSYVELSNGLVAVVARNDSDSYDRPLVRPLYDLRGAEVSDTYVDLRTETDIQIIDAISAEDIQTRLGQREMAEQSLSNDMDWADELVLD